jgi:hypothetical protein
LKRASDLSISVSTKKREIGQEDAVDSFIQRHRAVIRGVLSGLDRLVFRGNIRQIAGVEGMQHFLNWRRVLLKDFGSYVQRITDRVRAAAEETLKRAGRRPVQYVGSPSVEKEQLALSIARADGVTDGLICVLSCVEPCRSFFIYRNRETKFIELRVQDRKCLHLYFYAFDRVFGFMNARIMTWLPLRVQVCINGREWLSRRLDEAHVGYDRRDNTFARIDDLERAQAMFDKQLDTDWTRELTRIARLINPHHEDDDLFGGRRIDYYWSVYQSEWATDVMFDRPASLAKIYPGLVQHAITTFSSPDVLRFLGKPVRSNFPGEIVSDFKDRPEGVRVKHSADMNSVKVYDKGGSVLRVETTINDPYAFRAFRRAEGQKRGPKKWRYMRRGIADLRRRAEVSEASNKRYLEALGAVENPTRVSELIRPLTERCRWKGRPVRGLTWSKRDLDIVAAVMRGEHCISGFQNRDLQAALFARPPVDAKEKRSRTAYVTRLVRLLRAHRLVHKVTGTHRYRVSRTGRVAMTAILATQRMTLEQLARSAA